MKVLYQGGEERHYGVLEARFTKSRLDLKVGEDNALELRTLLLLLRKELSKWQGVGGWGEDRLNASRTMGRYTLYQPSYLWRAKARMAAATGVAEGRVPSRWWKVRGC